MRISPIESISEHLSEPFRSYVYDFCLEKFFHVRLLDTGEVMVVHIGTAWNVFYNFRTLDDFILYFPNLVVKLGGDPYCPAFTH